MTDTTTQSGFDEVWEQRYGNPAYRNRYPWSSVVSFVFHNMPKGRPRNDIEVVEVGCGNGPNLWFAAREGCRVAGIDGSRTAIDDAREWFARDKLAGEFHVGDFARLPFADERFDLAIDRAALSFSPTPTCDTALAELRRVLKRGGRLMFTPYSDRCSSFDGMPDHDGCYRQVTQGSIRPGAQVRFFSISDVRQSLADGWEIKSIEHHEQMHLLGGNRMIHAEWHVVAEKK